MFFDTKNSNECSGCTACMNACPVSAINMKEDREGFLYPLIDERVCINCGLCRKVCSWEHPKYENSTIPVVLASILKDKKERIKSTSGGVFYSIAVWIINNGGIVYGAAFDENLKLRHIGAETIEDLQKLRGSKYVQSDLGGTFKEIKNQLKNGRWCYFTGTACQVSGLKAFLGKEYDTLLTSDLVCHGVPSQKLFDTHISYLEEKYKDKVVGYQFRDYKRGEGCEICFFSKRRPIVNPSYELSPYLFGFMYGYTLRMCCFECKYAKIPRQGDLTLADYWNIEKFFPDFERRNGVSLVMLNTPKGENIWKETHRNCTSVYSRIEDACQANLNINHVTEKPVIRDIIFEEIEEYGYYKVAENRLKSPRRLRIRIEKAIKRIPGLLETLDLVRKVIRK